MSTFRLVALTVILVIAAITIVQNTQPVETKFLFLSFTMPRALLLMLTLLIGYVLGLSTAVYFSSTQRKKKLNENDEKPA
ncbi:MAG: lipopolysaccharide assembly protein LapA domain-containing protein [Planctomycetota bacterium]|nr:lipopolysaccharide assembly protein LapA domain-containing protein [Planctomycetota bacterium]